MIDRSLSTQNKISVLKPAAAPQSFQEMCTFAALLPLTQTINILKQAPTFLPNFLCSRSFLAFSDLSSIICFEISFFLIWREERILRLVYCILQKPCKYFFPKGRLSPSACAGLIWPSLQSNRRASWWICHAYSSKEVPVGLSPELGGSFKGKQNYKNQT